MPYSNLPKSKWEKMDRCVARLESNGTSKPSAIAICYTSLTKGNKKRATTKKEDEALRGALGRGPDGKFIRVGTPIEPGSIGPDTFRRKKKQPKPKKPKKEKKPPLTGDELAKIGVDKADLDAIKGVAESGNITEDAANSLLAKGFARRDEQGRLIIKAAAVTLMKAAERGDHIVAASAISKLQEPPKPKRTRRTGEDGSDNTDKSTSLLVFKQLDGTRRWFIVSTNSFEDRENEWLSEKGLKDAVALADKEQDYGVLRVWHIGDVIFENASDWRTAKAANGWDIGTVDFAEMVNRMMVHSGTFVNDEIGEVIERHAHKFKASVGFAHPVNEPIEGVYNGIKIFEVSLVPAEFAANPYTHVMI